MRTPSKIATGLFLVVALGFLARLRVAAAPPDAFQVVRDPSNSNAFFITHGQSTILKLDAAAWGPNWAWVSTESKLSIPGDVLDLTTLLILNAQPRQVVDFHLQARAGGTITFDYGLKSAADVPLTLIAATIAAPEGGHAQAVLTNTTGIQRTAQLPAGIAEYPQIKSIALSGGDWGGGGITIALDPPATIGTDGALRIVLASTLLKAGETRQTLTFSFPQGTARLVVKDADLAQLAPDIVTPDWFPYQPKWSLDPGPLAMNNWLDAPAGTHGGVLAKGDHFEFTDGTPVQFWGVNLAYALSAPAKADADFTAARFARFGVNAVRMHKFTGPGWEGIGDENDAARMKPDGLDKLDYFASQLKARGVYYGWSHTYHFKVRAGNKASISGYDELMKNGGGDTYGVINWAEDVQDLLIQQVVNLLQHTNPYTHTTYAQDPALCFIELQNEDDIFFFTSTTAYNNYPTYKKLLLKRFAEFLQTKYGTQDKLAAAWPGVLKAGETLAQANIEVQPNPWFAGDQHLPALRGGERQRVLDNSAFLFDTQNRFYGKFTKAIRDTGYKGPLIGSPWQAPTMLPHYLNLKADALVGTIDRHDYFGGGLKDTMLKDPGGGFLSAGLQQVAGLPFGLSEWIHVYPSLYSAESPVIMAAYGMGLQGWGSSYEFQSTSAHPAESVGNLPWGVWNADAPTQIGQYPILARMIQRGDVKQAPIIATRRIAAEDLATGQFNFSDSLKQQGDIKVFSGPEVLAAGRAVVDFVEKPAPSTLPTLAQYKQGSVITSATGQLTWDSAAGIITINTPGMQGFVGFAQDKTLKLADMTLTSRCPYASILLTAQEKTATLATAKTVLVSAMARNANTGFRCLSLDGKTILDNGHAPIMLEPVTAQVTFPNRRIQSIQSLTADGLPAQPVAPSASNAFLIDGKKDRALYYQITFE